MLDKKKITSLKNRMKKANISFNAIGPVMLAYELESMTLDQLIQLKSSIDFNYDDLNKIILTKQTIILERN